MDNLSGIYLDCMDMNHFNRVTKMAKQGRKQTNRIRVQGRKSGQVFVSIPKVLTLACGIRKGDEFEWVMIDGNLVLRRFEFETNMR